MNENFEIGKRIKKRRIDLDMTQEDLGKQLGLNKSTIQRYESGSISSIKLPVLQAIAKALNVNPEWLALKTDEMGIYDKAEMKIPSGTNYSPPERKTRKKIKLSDHERQLVLSYRKKPELQPAIDKLLEIESEENK